MRNKLIALSIITAATLLTAAAVAQQDRFTVKAGDMPFADFRGYENWKVVAVSHTDQQLKMIVANDVMIAAYRKGLPSAGKLFPEGSKIVKLEYSLKKNTRAPYAVDVPDALQTVATIEKDSKRWPDTHGWAYGAFDYTAATKSFKSQQPDAKCGYACHTAMASQDYIFTDYPFR